MSGEQLSYNEQETRKYERLFAILDHSSAEDILEAMRYLEADEASPDITADPASFELINSGNCFEALEKYPYHNIEHAREIYAAHAVSPLARDRERIAYLAHRITESDSAFGLHLWQQLIRDHDPDVREAAYAMLKDCISGARSDETFPIAGMTLADALRLQHAFHEAAEGRNLHDPRREAFARLRKLDEERVRS